MNHLDPNKKILYLDMDGVIADFEKTLYELFPYLKEYEPHSDALSKKIDELCAPGMPGARMFRDMEPIEFAVESYHILCDHYNVLILTSAPWLCHESGMDKRIWVEERLGPKVRKNIIISHHKGLNIGDYLVDDRLKNGVTEFKGEHIHFGQKGFENWPKTLVYLANKDGWKIPLFSPFIYRWNELLNA